MKKTFISLMVIVFAISSSIKAQQMKAVDLGLSVKWASCNLGTSQPEGAGDFYTWGDIKKWDESRTGDGKWFKMKWFYGTEGRVGGDGFTKYGYKDQEDYWSGTGDPDGKTSLDMADDAAHVKLGGTWRMPTYKEILELYNNCTWEWRIQNGVKGYKVTSNRNGRSIFLPIVGHWFGNKFKDDLFSCYMSSTLWENSCHCWGIKLSNHDVEIGNVYRNQGYSIRPVCR